MAEGAMITFWLIVGCGVLLSIVAALIPILPGTKEPFLLFVDESTGEIVYQYREKTKRFRFKGVTYDRKGEYMMIRGVKSRPIVLPDNAEFRAFAASLIQPNGK